MARREPENLLKSTSCSSINQDTSGCSDVKVIDLERTCFNCEMNLGWACKDGWAHCAICSGERFLGELVLNKQNNVLLLQGKTIII